MNAELGTMNAERGTGTGNKTTCNDCGASITAGDYVHLCDRCYNGMLFGVGDGQQIDARRDTLAGNAEAEQVRRNK